MTFVNTINKPKNRANSILSSARRAFRINKKIEIRQLNLKVICVFLEISFYFLINKLSQYIWENPMRWMK